MAEAAGNEQISQITRLNQVERQRLDPRERYLTEVDNLNRLRLPNGEHDPWVLDEMLKNMVSAVKEGGMPYAVHQESHPYQPSGERDASGERLKSYMWLGRTAVQNAESGLAYHRLPAALERVAVEVEEARDTEANLRPGIKKVFISPRMSPADASYEAAKAEHLADEDSIRVSEAVLDAQGNIKERALESALVRDIPLQAWVDMLANKDNIFGKSIAVQNPESALSVMKVHHELEVPAGALPEGVISLIAAVLPYIKDPATHKNVSYQLGRFREKSQEDKHEKAVSIAKRWQGFEVSLADSLEKKVATPEVRAFINSMQDQWNKDDLAVIQEHHQGNANYAMSRPLAVIVERAKQHLLLARAGIITGNEKVTNQLDPKVVEQIYRDEMIVQIAYRSGMIQDTHALEAEQNRFIASQNLKSVGGGCVGENDAEFNDDPFNDNDNLRNDKSELSGSERRTGKTKRGRCIIENCPTSPREVKVGACNICIKPCQELFDRGQDPTKLYAAKSTAGKAATKPAVEMKANSHEFSLKA